MSWQHGLLAILLTADLVVSGFRLGEEYLHLDEERLRDKKWLATQYIVLGLLLVLLLWGQP